MREQGGLWIALTKRLRAFGDSRSGATAIIYALCGVALMGLLGLTVDFTRAQTLRAQMQNAADGAVLVAARDPDATMAERNQLARAYFDAEVGGIAAESSFTLTQVSHDGFRVEAAYSMPMSLAAIVRNEPWRIQVAAEAEQSGVNLEVALVLDTTGSMGGSRIRDLRDAAEDLVEIVIRDSQTPYYSKVAMAPYSNSVNLGSYAAQIRGPVTGPVNITDATRANPVVITAARHGLRDGDRVYIEGVSGMTELNGNLYTVDDATRDTFELRGVNGRWYNRYRGGGRAHCTESGCDYFRFTSASWSERVFPVTDCVTERTGSYAYTDDPPSRAYLGYNYAGSSNGCTSQNLIVPLTDNEQSVINRISGLQASGSTAGHIGIAWGWYLLSPDFGYLWPAASRPAAYGEHDVLKVAVIMTDGEFNTPYCEGVIARDAGSGSGSSSDHNSCNAPNGSSYYQAKRLCAEMQDAGIVIYSVGFDIDRGGNAEDVLESCADDDDHFYKAANGDELRTAFRSIATSITQLRITR